jgi:hypothetical protein
MEGTPFRREPPIINSPESVVLGRWLAAANPIHRSTYRLMVNPQRLVDCFHVATRRCKSCDARPVSPHCTYFNNHCTPCTPRQAKYTHNATSISLKCHGAFGASPSSSPGAGTPSDRASIRNEPFVANTFLQSGHAPSEVIAFGAQYFEHVSHHGMIQTPTAEVDEATRERGPAALTRLGTGCPTMDAVSATTSNIASRSIPVAIPRSSHR